MNEFDDRGQHERGIRIAQAAQRAAAQKYQHGADALAAGFHDIAGNLIRQFDLGARPLVQQVVHCGEVVSDQRTNLIQGHARGCRPDCGRAGRKSLGITWARL